jgi:hypothetical protein
MEKEPFDNSYKAEKRMHPRSAYVQNIRFRLVGDDNAANPFNGKGETRDISYSGMRLLLNRELAPGEILELSFERGGKDESPIVKRVKVVWSKKSETGFLTGVKFDLD